MSPLIICFFVHCATVYLRIRIIRANIYVGTKKLAISATFSQSCLKESELLSNELYGKNVDPVIMGFDLNSV